MLNERYIYDRDHSFFKSALNASNVMKGRYHISPNYGHDLNTANLDSFLKDPAYGIMDAKTKYPLCVLITPKSRIVKFNGSKWEEFVFSLFFLTQAYVSGGRVKNLNAATNSSAQNVWYDWDDMKSEAMFFLETILSTIKATQYAQGIPMRAVMNVQEEGATVGRVSRLQNDKLNGVSLTFLLYARTKVCEAAGVVLNLQNTDGNDLLNTDETQLKNTN